MSISTASAVRVKLAKLPARSFVQATTLPGPTEAVEAELGRLTKQGELRRVRKGLYWKGPKTRFGIAAPDPAEVALEVAGRGAGPAGIAAASWLGLTTQIAGRPIIAVPGRTPMGVPGTQFCSRPPIRRELGLRPLEVAVLEVLRDWPMSVEVGWDDVVIRIHRLAESGEIRPTVIAKDVVEERRPGLRDRWAAAFAMEA